MKQFITLCLLLTVIEFVQSLEHEKWVSNAKEFVADKRIDILNTEPTTYSFCLKLRQHDLAFEELELIRNFDDCQKSENPNRCYFRRERAFHDNVIDASKPSACVDDMCLFWAVRVRKIMESTSQIIVRHYWDDLIEIWSRCDFMKPVVDASLFLNKKSEKDSKEGCVAPIQQEIANAIQTTWEDFGICKNEMMRLNKYNMTSHQWISFNVAQSSMNDVSACSNESRKIFQQSFENSKKKIEECKKKP